MKTRSYALGLCCLAAGAALMPIASPVMAQAADEDIIVTGRYGRVPDNVQSRRSMSAMLISISARRPGAAN